jgi:hypothetical protein
MTMTGASRKLEELLERFQSHMKLLQDDVLPRIKEFQKQEQVFKQLNNSLSNEQKTELQKMGYAKMTENQLELVYNEKGDFILVFFEYGQKLQ